jgi:hypothetical protein
MRPLLSLGAAVTVLGIGLLAFGVRQQITWAGCSPRCVEPASWPVTVGILMLIGGGFLLIWTAASGYASRALHPAHHLIEERDRLRRIGLAGTARVLRAESVGTSAVGEPLVDLELDVRVSGREPYQVQHRTAAPRHRERLYDGKPVPVMVDPEDPQHLVVEWTRDVIADWAQRLRRRLAAGRHADGAGPEAGPGG